MTRIIQISLRYCCATRSCPMPSPTYRSRGGAPGNPAKWPLKIVTIPRRSAGRDMACRACDRNAATVRKMHPMVRRGKHETLNGFKRLGGTRRLWQDLF